MSQHPVEYRIVLRKSIVAPHTLLSTGVIIVLNRTAPPIIQLLRNSYLADASCLKASRAAITYLFHFPGQGILEDEAAFSIEYFEKKRSQ